MKYLLIALCLLSCNDDELDNITIIPTELQPLFDMFKEEAALRGVHIDYTGVKVRYEDMSGTPYTGYAYPKKMLITLDSSKLSYKKFQQRIVFHELGHLLLGRDHDDTRMGKKEVIKSLMNCCYAPERYYETVPAMQKYYLDELFNPNTPCPDWAN